jgi:hypothetical protein
VTRLGRYWLFFVIVAVGLALSWGQVGRKAHRVLSENPTVLLQTERPCQPSAAPCAAMGASHAIVMGPAAPGWRIVSDGFDTATVIDVLASMLDANGAVARQLTLDAGASEWRVAPMPPDIERLRIQISTNNVAVVAEFPLAPAVRR